MVLVSLDLYIDFRGSFKPLSANRNMWKGQSSFLVRKDERNYQDESFGIRLILTRRVEISVDAGDCLLEGIGTNGEGF